jgi:hypothetical protein
VDAVVYKRLRARAELWAADVAGLGNVSIHVGLLLMVAYAVCIAALWRREAGAEAEHRHLRLK